MTVPYDDAATAYDAALVNYDGMLFIPGVAPGRYWSVIQAGFGTPAPQDPNSTVTAAGTLNLGGWTTLSTVAGAGVRDTGTARTSQNKSDGICEPGLATLVMDDIRGWLDPGNPYGPYYGYLVPGTPIRKLTTDGAGHYWPAYRGFVSKWPSSQGRKGLQDAKIECYDPIGWLGGVPPKYPSALYRAVMDTGPSSYWPHNDPSGGTAIHDVVSGFGAWLNGAATIGGPSITPEGYGGSAQFTNQPTSFVQAPLAALPRPPFTIGFQITLLVDPPSGVQSVLWAGLHPGGTFAAGTASGFWLEQLGATISNGSTATTRIGWYLQPGVTRYAMFVCQVNGTSSTYINGFLQDSLYTTLTPCAYTTFKWGAALGLDPATPWSNAAPSSVAGADISHVAVWPRALTSAEAGVIGAAAHVARSGESAHDRFNYLLDQVGWPTGLRNVGATKTTPGPVDLTAGVILDPLRNVCAYEDGIMGAKADGTVFLIGRDGDPASSFSIGGTANPTEDPVWSTDELTAVSSVTAGNPPVTLTAGNSIISGRQITLSQLAVTVDDAATTAQRAVQLGQQPRPGIDTITVDPVLVPAALSMDVGDVGTVTRRPIWAPGDIVAPFQVTAIADVDGADKRLLRTFTMLAPRRHQWHLRAPNANPTGATAANNAAMSPASLTVEALFRLDNWAMSTTGLLVAHADNTPQTSGFMFVWFTSGTPPVPYLGLLWGNNAGTQVSAASYPIYRQGNYMWAKVTLDPSTGTVTFWLSFGNRSSYVNWGQTVVGATTLRSYTGAMKVGQDANGAYPLIGDVLIAKVADLAGNPIASMDPTADNQPGASSWTASTGETWSLQGSGSLISA